MAVALPSAPSPRKVKPRLLRYGEDHSPMSGATTRVQRLGTRYAIDVELPPMSASAAQDWIDRRLQADTAGETVTLPVPQPGLALPANIAVNGASQSGSLLMVTGATAGHKSRFFSFAAGGRLYLHRVTGVAGSVLTIAPMLRASPANGGVLNFAAPLIEGFIEGEEVAWDVDLAAIYGMTFTLFEDA